MKERYVERVYVRKDVFEFWNPIWVGGILCNFLKDFYFIVSSFDEFRRGLLDLDRDEGISFEVLCEPGCAKEAPAYSLNQNISFIKKFTNMSTVKPTDLIVK